MEATTDWRGFQSVFQPRRRLRAEPSTARITVVCAQGQIIAAQTDGEDLSHFVGMRFEEFCAQHANREIVTVDQTAADEQLRAILGLGHYYDQCEGLRAQVPAGLVQKAGAAVRLKKIQGVQELLATRHFLLDAVQTWWTRVLPAQYGIYLRIEGQDGADSLGGRGPRQYLMKIKNGKVEGFFSPDLSLMIPERRRVPQDVVIFLAERTQAPVQGLFVTSEQWARWSAMGNPWAEIAITLKKTPGILISSSKLLTILIRSRGLFQ